MELYTKDLLLKTVTIDDIEEVTRMWEFEKGKHKIIGWCGLDGKTAGKLHIFFLIDKNYKNKGYATQNAGKLLSYAFDEAYVPFVNGGCDKDNTASYKVMQCQQVKHQKPKRRSTVRLLIEVEVRFSRAMVSRSRTIGPNGRRMVRQEL